MHYTPNIVSTVLFECSNVCIIRIPPGPPKLSKWNLDERNTVWKGSLRFIEQETIQEVAEAYATHNIVGESQELYEHAPPNSRHYDNNSTQEPIPAHHALRAKIELYTPQMIPPSVGSLISVKKDVPWAEIWYNPTNDSDIKVANNGEETVQISDSSKLYKVIAQLPGTGYHLSCSDEEVLQVGLGLRFLDSYQAISFSESLGLYRRRFRNFKDHYEDELKARSIRNESKHPTIDEEEESDEFDEFVSSS